MKFDLKIVAIGLTLVGFIGCGGDDKVAKKNVEMASLNGDWVKQCNYNTNDTTSKQDSFKFLDGKLNGRFVIYDNETCDSSPANSIISDLTYNYNYSLGEDFETATNKKTTKFDMTYTGYNANSGEASNLPSNGEKLYTIIYINNNNLYLGDITIEYNATTETTRPIAIDFSKTFTKQ